MQGDKNLVVNNGFSSFARAFGVMGTQSKPTKELICCAVERFLTITALPQIFIPLELRVC